MKDVKLKSDNIKDTYYDNNDEVNKFEILDKNSSLMDRLIDQAGFSDSTKQIFAIQFLILFLDGIHLSFISLLFIPLEKNYSLSKFQMSLISSIMIISVGVGAIISSNKNIVSDRRMGLVGSTLLIFFANLIFSISKYYTVFFIMRIFIGIGFGIMLPISNNILCEYLPTKKRSFYIILTNVGFNLGAIYLNSLIYFIMPNYEVENLYLVMLLAAIPNIFIGVYIFLKSKDSPRNLILNNRADEGLHIIEEITNTKLSEEDKGIIIKETQQGSNIELNRKLSEIFNSKFLKISIIMIAIWSANSFIASGNQITTSLILERIENIENNHTKISSSSRGNNTDNEEEVNTQLVNLKYLSIIKNQFLIYIVSLPGPIIAAYMTEVQIFGRKMTTFVGLGLTGIFCLFAIISTNNFALFSGLGGIAISLSFSASNCYASEIYPTKIRDIAVGFLYFCMKLSSFLAQFIAMELFKLFYLSQIYLSVIICMVVCIMTYMLPYDTFGRALDF